MKEVFFNIGRYNRVKESILSEERLLELFVEYRHGDILAKKTIIERNLYLVNIVINSIRISENDIEDAFQIGSIGLIKAVERFDLSYNVKFSTYAIPNITGEIKQHFRGNWTIRVSRKKKELQSKAKFIMEKFEKKFGRAPTLIEICKEINVDQKTLETALIATQTPISLYTVIYENESDPIFLIDTICEEITNNDYLDDKLMLGAALKKLNSDERKILYYIYGLQCTQSYISKIIGCSQVEVSRKKIKILNKIRNDINRID